MEKGVNATPSRQFVFMFIRFDMIHERDGRTDTDRHRMMAKAALA